MRSPKQSRTHSGQAGHSSTWRSGTVTVSSCHVRRTPTRSGSLGQSLTTRISCMSRIPLHRRDEVWKTTVETLRREVPRPSLDALIDASLDGRRSWRATCLCCTNESGGTGAWRCRPCAAWREVGCPWTGLARGSSWDVALPVERAPQERAQIPYTGLCSRSQPGRCRPCAAGRGVGCPVDPTVARSRLDVRCRRRPAGGHHRAR